ncbi:xanthine dehydrogenase family protein molybdopterin-binding subunit [Clostridium magnum]|uniref:Putative xanthine dehydrogenase subunit D n=1 Tax=Clostridium magnum DSM 2767 TaxID=1121326 RepID=A0A162R0W2_9CLOT|nr:xanthine dehydrogenase family protein molybdopterin-binding subunit [Clostridium magnum]KZL89254.1 putative xanthine dehydrogenase subunit D [Clostridium magnum DSM 2767]SHI97414.1 CO or xanthine dehydrogenase, Mo-binding subunit [Clostridium magnum DSM 2767]
MKNEISKRKIYDRQDAYAKITGKAKYIDDLKFPGMLYVQTVRIGAPHARILNIDSSEALKVKGVVGVYTAKDVPGVNQTPKDRPALAEKETKFAGDGVAIVVANTKVQAAKAAKLVKIEYEELPYVVNPEEALKEGAPILHGNSNFAASHKTVKGNLEKGFAEADVILEREFSTQRVMHSAIEPDGAIAIPEAKGVLIYCPGKGPFNIKRAVAAYCGFNENQVRVIQPTLGGVFGGKDSDINIIASRVTMAAMITGRPCKMVWNREEVLEEGTKRHPFKLKYKIGAKKDGYITAMEINGLVDVGAYITKSQATIWRATVEATGPYNVENLSTNIVGAFTNNTISDAVRGFGSPQVDFASESLMNELAKELGMDPLELRRINAFKEGSITATGQKLQSVNLMACLDKLEEEFPVHEKSGPAPKGKVRGRGISCIFRGEAMGAGFPVKDAAAVSFHVEKDGTIVVLSGITEQGQGGTNVVLQIISETLGVSIENMRISPLDTSYLPDSGATVGSRGTITSGNAALVAANDAKDRMSKVIAKKWGAKCEDLVFENDTIFTKDKSENISFKEAVTLCYKEIPGVYGYGWWSLPPVWWDFEKNCGETYASFNYGACGAEVEIDLITGKVDVINLVAIHDVGRIINEAEVKAQIAGGVSMALGFALTEEVTTKNGKLLTKNFDKYLLQTTADFYNLKTIPLEAKAGNNPLGVKGVSESSTATVSPAVLNAIENALGVRIRNLPADLESVFSAIEESQKLGYIQGGAINE